jgi:hypothetical protein
VGIFYHFPRDVSLRNAGFSGLVYLVFDRISDKNLSFVSQKLKDENFESNFKEGINVLMLG